MYAKHSFGHVTTVRLQSSNDLAMKASHKRASTRKELVRDAPFLECSLDDFSYIVRKDAALTGSPPLQAL